jgi:hypothetical protein
MLNVLKTVSQEIGNDKATKSDAYKVRRSKVGMALRWLVKYNPEYSDITIDMEALDWLDGEEGTLVGLLEEPEEMTTETEAVFNKNTDMGPNIEQTLANVSTGDNVKEFGYVADGGKIGMSVGDQQVMEAVQESIEKSKNKEKISVAWPAVEPVPINEYTYPKLFARAYPWLFPGGLGDVKDFPGTMKKWGEHMLYYEDGRFTKDKFFAFFALNYITRNRNNSSGSWFIRDFNKGGPETLEELQETIVKGDTRFVNQLTYFSKCVKGSSPYWFQKRSELYTWINSHVEKGNGAPTMFITLSCGEYYWPDIIELLQERMKMAGEDPSTCYAGSPQLSKILNEYSIVVQEYFQKRVEIWLETVGKHNLGIKHYWVRYEFAPGRGQIHAHLLAIPSDHSIYKICHEHLKHEHGEERRAEALAKWAKEKMGMTASVNDGFNSRTTDPAFSPTSVRLTDINTTEEDYIEDQQDLLNYCQCHECSGFCMRNKHGKK